MKLNVSPTVIRTLVEQEGYFRTTSQAFQYWKTNTSEDLTNLDKEQIKALFEESDLATHSIQDYIESEQNIRLTAANIKTMFMSEALKGVRRKSESTGTKGPKRQEVEFVFDDSATLGVVNENDFNEDSSQDSDDNGVEELDVVEESSTIPNFTA